MGTKLLAYLDIGIGLNLSGRVVFEFFPDVSERLVENFAALCRGDRTTSVRGRLRKLTYEGCKVFKVIKGEYLQCGDFINNDGTASGSIYGESFKDYPTSRLHSNAGLLTIHNINSINHGDNNSVSMNNGNSISNDTRRLNQFGSQFCILFGKVTRFDRSNVVIGRVVEGMEFIRAIENVPVDNKFKPKIEIGILSSGTFNTIQHSVTEITKQKDLINSLMSTIESKDVKSVDLDDLDQVRCVYTGRVNRRRLPSESSANTLGKKLLTEALQGIQHHYVPKDPDITTVTEGTTDTTDSVEKEPVDTVQPLEPVESEEIVEKEPVEDEEDDTDDDVEDSVLMRLRKLSGKMSECSRLNNAEIILEQKIKSNPKSELYISKSYISQSEGKDVDKDISSNLSKELNISAGMVEKIHKIQKTKEKNKTFGWNVFNQDALYRAHKKRVRETGFNPDLYEKQKSELGDQFYSPGVVNFTPTESTKDVIVRNVEKQYKKRDEFSRRRLYDDDAQDISYINERNRVFNKKLERSFGAYSSEIKQNLERGTAL